MAKIPIEVLITAKDEASKVLKNFGGAVSKGSTSIQDFARANREGLLALSAFGATAGLAAKSFVSAASELEQQTVAFETLTGSVEVGRKTLKDLIDFAAKTPFEIPQILEQSKRLLAMGTTAEDLIPTFKALGNVASGVGMEKLPQLVLAFGQIQAKGRLMGTELRQLTEAGFNLADAMGITNKELESLVSEGMVSFSDVKQAFIDTTTEGGRFFNLMENMSQTTAGQLSNLKDNMFKVKAALGEALLPAVNSLIEALTPALQKFSEWATEHQNLVAIGVILAGVIGAIGAAALILGPIISGISTLFSLFSGTIGIVIKIVTTLIGVLGGPLTLIILAVGALVAALALAWKNNWFGIRDVVNNVVSWFTDTAFPAIRGFFDNITNSVRSAVQVWIDRFNAVRSVVQTVIDTIRGIISAAEDLARRVAGGLRIPGFQHGGVVPGPVGQAQLATVHGGEEVVPVSRSKQTGGGGGGVTINVQVGLYAGTETEKRNIGMDLYQAIVRVAQAQNLTVAELLGA